MSWKPTEPATDKSNPGDAVGPSAQCPPAAPVRRGRGRPRKTAAERDEGNRRRELLHAAARLFCEQGFDATSTRDVAAAVGMQSGSPFYHFRTKGDLLFAVMRQGMQDAIERQTRLLKSLRKSEQTMDDPRGLLRHLIQQHVRILHGRGQAFIQVMLHEWRALNAVQQAELKALQRDYEAPWEPVLQALHQRGQLGCEPGLARLLVFGALNWSMHWYSPRKGGSASEMGDALLGLIVRPAP